MRGKIGALLLLALLPACVEETDPSLREAEAAPPAPAATAAPAPLPARAVASMTEWQVVLSHVEVAAGTLAVDVENNGAEAHALEIEGGGQEWRSDLIQPGESVTMSLVLAPGTYHVYCPLASGGESHADRGMKTTLRVR